MAAVENLTLLQSMSRGSKKAGAKFWAGVKLASGWNLVQCLCGRPTPDPDGEGELGMGLNSGAVGVGGIALSAASRP